MNIRQAWKRFGNSRDFVDWALENNYSYYLTVQHPNERGGIRSKGYNGRWYEFNY